MKGNAGKKWTAAETNEIWIGYFELNKNKSQYRGGEGDSVKNITLRPRWCAFMTAHPETLKRGSDETFYETMNFGRAKWRWDFTSHGAKFSPAPSRGLLTPTSPKKRTVSEAPLADIDVQ